MHQYLSSIPLCLSLVNQLIGQSTSTTALPTEPNVPSKTIFEPTANYAIEQIAGWEVYFNNRLLKENPELAEQVRRELTRQLDAIVVAVPRNKVEMLRRTKIWVEHFHPKFPCACYHPNVEWLKENGFNPDKVDSVDISNPQNFVDWTGQQPWMVLHELAHAYHDQVLRHDHKGIRRAFERAKQTKNYVAVKHIDGRTVRHYALSNDQEYFAEATEAYFGKNDFYPFTRNELEEFDPAGYALMQEIWE